MSTDLETRVDVPAGRNGHSPAPPRAPGAGRRRTRRIEAFTVVSYLGAAAFAVTCVVPLWMIISGSFTSETTLARTGYSLWPAPWSFEAYQLIFTGSALPRAYLASFFVTGVGTALSVAAAAGIAWVIARRFGRLSAVVAVFAYIPMLFSGGLVPLYLLVTQVLQLRDTWWAVILPHLVAPFLVFIAVSALRQLPDEILEAARVDGAGELQIFFRIILPLSRPILAVIALFYAVTYWNEWFNGLLFLTDRDLFPLQLVLQNLIANVTGAADLPSSLSATPPIYQLRFALTVVTIGPIALAYPFAQRYFVKGLTLGATKG